jgi:hypothetical protein
MSAELVAAIDAALAHVRACPDEMSRAEVDHFHELADAVYLLAVREGLAHAAPQMPELRPQLESCGSELALPPVQFEGKLNLPGDWAPAVRPDDSSLARLRLGQHDRLVLLPARELLVPPRWTDPEPPPPARVFMVCASPRWRADMTALRTLALPSAPPAPPSASAPGDEPLPWGGPSWDELPPLTRRLLLYMHGREAAQTAVLIERVWCKDDVTPDAVRKALSRANAFLGSQGDTRFLEKARGEELVRWV